MSTPNFSYLENATTLEEIQGALSQLRRTLDFYFQGKLSSSNIREIAGWQVSEDSLMSDDGDVGFSTLDTSGDDLRIWAGSSNRNSAPFRVYESGRVDATNLHLHGGSLTIGSSFSVNSAGILTASGANISGNITMNGGSINWNNVNSDPATANALNNALMAQTIANQIVSGTYTGGTFIDGKNVMSPNIYAGYIYGTVIQGATITANSTINVGTDARIGSRLIIQPSIVGGIQFGETPAQWEIYIDPMGGGMTIKSFYYLHLNTTAGSVIINGMDVVSQINALWQYVLNM